MTGQELLDLMAFADSRYIEEADTVPEKKRAWKKWGVLAACLCLVLGTVFAAGDHFPGAPLPAETTPPGETLPANATASAETAGCVPELPNYYSLEEFVFAQRTGELEQWLPNQTYFYLLEKSFPDYRFHMVEVTRQDISFTYVPDVPYSFYTPNTGILVRIEFGKQEDSLDKLAEQLGISRTPEGHLYVKEHRQVYFIAENCRVSVQVPEAMNDYNTLKSYCSLKAVFFADFEIPENYYTQTEAHTQEELYVMIPSQKEYIQFLETQDDPVLTLEALQQLGSFESFTRVYNAERACAVYRYILKDAQGNLLFLFIEPPYFADFYETPSVELLEGSDLRHIPEEDFVHLRHNGFVFHYNHGKLYQIDWEQNGRKFSLGLASAKDLGDLSIEETNLMGRLLMGTAELPVLPGIP